MQAIYRQLKIFTQLHLVYHQTVINTFTIPFFYIIVKLMIFLKVFEFDFCQVNVDYIGCIIIFDNIIRERGQQF